MTPSFPIRIALISALLIAGFALGAAAQMSVADHRFMDEMTRSMSTMDQDMASVCMTGDTDRDFAAMMLPHHRGAIDMAKAELRYGTDPVMRRLAQEILVDQQSEIDAMNLWLGKRQSLKTGEAPCASH
ncbi:protein of unknown function DUF305 [Candidatus Koribacter versatilis Ellin345]|uniref:DUF305 domain-containing protein n=1 Tax=Koribacter versatilis (strain Ellin345) TaxID=204669 RepID=Q1IQ64_KORVE|nr:DUF305 domain-containing protein [Candidatus Koribacter versatilis]ABF40986.1 protein of unknown function DUF305 [Candidatus Koribacter versatilis Ellin345]